MKKRWLLMAPACILVLFTAAALLLAVGRRPYKNLDAAQIASAKVRLSPPDKTVEIENASELAGCLNDVVIYYQDNSYTEYAGQAAVFTLTMTDGTQTEIAAYSPFLIIDGVGYKTKQEPCEALSRYADELLRIRNRRYHFGRAACFERDKRRHFRQRIPGHLFVAEKGC